MLYMPKTRFAQSHTRNLNAGSILVDEGVALVSAPGGTVKVGSGVSGEIFVGFALFQRGHLLSIPKFEEVVALADGHVHKLNRTPLGGVVVVRNRATNTALVSGTDYEYDVGTNEVTLTDEGTDVTIAYEYSPTQVEARVIQGDVQPGGVVPVNYPFTGVIAKGDVYTSHFDINSDWTNPNAVIRVGANGKLTTSGSGAIVDAYVISAPNAELGFLGLCLK